MMKKTSKENGMTDTEKGIEMKKRMGRVYMLKTVFNVVVWILIAITALAALALVGVRVVGLQPFTVLSGSMEPTYHVGSLIYVKKVDYRTITEGDPITFMLDKDTVATHRVIEVVPDEEDPSVIRFRTKGDNNEIDDGAIGIHYKNVIGKPIFTIPYLGYVANYVQNPPGCYVAIAAAAILLLLVFLPNLFADSGEKKDRSTKG